MKKILCLCFILCLTLSGCQASRVPGLDWNPEEMVELRCTRPPATLNPPAKLPRTKP